MVEAFELFLVPARGSTAAVAKGRGMFYPVCWMVRIKETLAVNR